MSISLVYLLVLIADAAAVEQGGDSGQWLNIPGNNSNSPGHGHNELKYIGTLIYARDKPENT